LEEEIRKISFMFSGDLDLIEDKVDIERSEKKVPNK
jgi:hypothetical protein